ncbi:TetR/AcrR family transcriptional regulator [Frankia sp. Cpl3]|nr:TetR/AcrR family transcriptional regulator [Frankia sp. Cpl3]
MEAAVRVMSRDGYLDLSVANVLNEADLSTTSFYRHFDSKDVLLGALIRRDAASVENRLKQAISGCADPVTAVEAWLDGVLDLFYEPKRAARMALFITPITLGTYSIGQDLAEMHWIVSRPLAEVLRAGHEADVLFSPTPAADALGLFAVISSVAASPHARHRDRTAARTQAIRFARSALRLPQS